MAEKKSMLGRQCVLTSWVHKVAALEKHRGRRTGKKGPTNDADNLISKIEKYVWVKDARKLRH
ncbi:hypothetical protein LguiB_005498 [Lonicera macranthoides]